MFQVDNLLVIGAGLIGASVGLGLKENGFCNKLGFIDNSLVNITHAKENKLVDWVGTNLKQIEQFNPNIIVVATPTLVTKKIIKELIAKLNKTVVITDVASTKGNLSTIRSVNYIPSHPIAGREKSGFDAADSKLLKSAKVIITPSCASSKTNVKIIKSMWESLGANVVTMDAMLHDKVFAYTSHLPHLVAYSIITTLLDTNIKDDIFSFAGGGLKDYTRVAASDPIMWHDICISNKNEIIQALSDFEQSISVLKKAINNSDSKKIMSIFEESRAAKLEFNK